MKCECKAPSVDEFLALRAITGWSSVERSVAAESLHNSLFHVVVYDDFQLVGMGRVVGDGAMYFYVQP